MTYKEFIENHGIEMKVRESFFNPHMEDFDGFHFQCQLTSIHPRSTIMVFFSKGKAHVNKAGKPIKPTIEEVLDCLVSDAQGVEDRTFEEWASDYGYDTDSRKAEAIYNACKDELADLTTLLTYTEYAQLRDDIERL